MIADKQQTSFGVADKQQTSFGVADKQQRAFGVCERPITIKRSLINETTGEIRREDVSFRCGTRRQEDCEPCSRVWRDDAFHVLREGAAKSTSLTFITLTAPGKDVFGRIHTAQHHGKMSERCDCRDFHDPADPLIGIPTDVESYEYKKVAEFNKLVSRLTAITLQKIWRTLAKENGVAIKDARLPTARVVEWQRRGLLHVHILIQGEVPTAIVEAAVRGREAEDGRKKILPSETQGFRWGHQVVVKHVASNDRSRLASYFTKVVTYAVKDVTTAAMKNDLPIAHVHRSKLESAGEKSVSCREINSSATCNHGWSKKKVRLSGVVTEIEIGGRTSRLCRKHNRARKQFGFTGNVLTLNRSWGITMGEMKQRRRLWVQQNQKVKQSEWDHFAWEGFVRTAPAVRLESIKKLVSQSSEMVVQEVDCLTARRAHSRNQHAERVLQT